MERQSLFFIFLLDTFGNFEFTGDLCLAEPAPGDLYAVFSAFGWADDLVAVLVALILVMASRGDRPGRTAFRARFAAFVEKIKAI
jgi:hypothetical protein